MSYPVRDLATRVASTYAQVEINLLLMLSNRVSTGISDPQWAVRRAAELRLVTQNARQIQLSLLATQNQVILDAVSEAYMRGDLAAVQQLTGTLAPHTQSSQAIVALSRDLQSRLGSTHFAITRQVEDVYRNVIANASAPGILGTETRRQVAQRSLTNFATRGVTGFVDRAGRNWDLVSYAEMASRTTMMRAAVQGHSDRLRSNGYDLVIVSGHDEACPFCDDWEGAILSQSGNHAVYEPLDNAIAAGLFHPNCEHSIHAYIEGMTQPWEHSEDEDEREARYEATQEQRYNERKIREWKRKEAVAFTPQAQQQSTAKIQDWQTRQREHTEAWNLRRKYERESITQAR